MKYTKTYSVFVTIIILLEVNCDHKKIKNKELIPIIFVILSQSNVYHKQLADNAKQNIIKQSRQLQLDPPAIYLSHEEWPNAIGDWTVFPLLGRLAIKLTHHHSWLFICEETTHVNVEKLLALLKKFNSSEDLFLGHALRDKQATIIHHFAFAQDPSSFAYPDFAAGFLLSKSLFKKISERWKKSKYHGFSIDAKHELATFIWNEGKGIRLLHIPELCLIKRTENCTTWIAKPFPLCEFEVSKRDICFAVKTCEKYHLNRVPIVKNTWAKDAGCITFYSDKKDEHIPTIDLGIPNVESGHCAKTLSIIQNLMHSHSYRDKKWFIIADDDTLLSIPRLLKLLQCYNSTEAIALGERYGYNVASDDGYNYITGGGGMVFSRETIKQLISCKCPAADSPDDMILGICLRKLKIPIVHSKLFHQARPVDYSYEYISQPAVSFHKHWMIDPQQVYNEWLTDKPKHKRHNEL